MLRPLVIGLVLAVSALLLGNVDRFVERAGADPPFPPPTKGTAGAASGAALAKRAPEAEGKEALAEPPPFSLHLVEIASGLERPVFVGHAGDGSGRLFVLEQTGRVRVIKDGRMLPQPFLDVSKLLGSTRGEQGLLGIAFHPKFRDNGVFFLAYTDREEDDAVARYRAKRGADVADATSGRVLFSIEDPAANHNGGMLAFGKDGLLYIGTGDGGGANNVFKTSMDPQSLLGKMLRIDVDVSPQDEAAGRLYRIPKGNAYEGRGGGKPEIWALGLRNPWRYSFDRQTGDLWIADVGQNTWEEVNLVEQGALRGGLNFGWSRLEGFECFDARPCTASGTVLPVFTYGRREGCSVTGGYVYRGAAHPAMQGAYLVGDYCTGNVWSLRKDGARVKAAKVADTDASISSFGEDEAGELYLVDHKGKVFRIEGPAPAAPASP